MAPRSAFCHPDPIAQTRCMCRVLFAWLYCDHAGHGGRLAEEPHPQPASSAARCSPGSPSPSQHVGARQRAGVAPGSFRRNCQSSTWGRLLCRVCDHDVPSLASKVTALAVLHVAPASVPTASMAEARAAAAEAGVADEKQLPSPSVGPPPPEDAPATRRRMKTVGSSSKAMKYGSCTAAAAGRLANPRHRAASEPSAHPPPHVGRLLASKPTMMPPPPPKK